MSSEKSSPHTEQVTMIIITMYGYF